MKKQTTTDANALNATEILAISKAVSDAAVKAVRPDVKPGVHKGVLRVDIAYELKVGEDHTQKIVEKAQPWTLLAVALSKLNGVTVSALVREATTLPDELVNSIKKSAEAAMAELKAPTDTLCKGKVTGTVTVAKIS